MRLQIGGKIRKIGIKDPVQIEICTLQAYKIKIFKENSIFFEF
jgi:hypothetical protein